MPQSIDYAALARQHGGTPDRATADTPEYPGDPMDALRSLSAMQTPFAMRSHGDTPPPTTARVSAGTSTARVPPEQLGAAFRSRMMAAPGNILDAYAENGPMQVFRGLKDLYDGNLAKGAHEGITGAGVTALPAALPAMVASTPALLSAVSAAIFGAGGRTVGRSLAEYFDATPDQVDLAGDVGGLGAGYLGSRVPAAAGAMGSAARNAVVNRAHVIGPMARTAISPSPANILRTLEALSRQSGSEAASAAPVDAPVAPTAATARPAPPATRGVAPRPSAQAAPVNAPAAATFESLGLSSDDAGILSKLGLTPADYLEGQKYAAKGMPPEKVIETLLNARQFNTMTRAHQPERAAARLSRGRASGRTPDTGDAQIIE